jgi:hypothetical protein
MKRSVIFYRTGKDECPVQDFLDSLPGKVAQKITWVLKLVEDLDVVPSTYFKKLVGTEGIWECRIQYGSDAYRLLCFFLQILWLSLPMVSRKNGKKPPPRKLNGQRPTAETF